MAFTCERCGYEATQKVHLINHLQRKKACQPDLSNTDRNVLLEELTNKDDLPFKCDNCGTGFKYRQSKYRHEQTCEQTNVIRKLTKELKSLKRQMEIVSSGNNATNNTNNGNITTNNTTNTTNANVINNITVNGLGKEDIGYLTEHPRFQQFMIKCIKERTDGIMEYLEKKHFDPSHPENHNLKKMKRDDFIEVYDGKKWRLRFKEDVLEDVFEHMQRDFANFVEEAFIENGQLQKRILDQFMNTVGKPLNWDLTAGEYEYEGEIEEEKRQQLQTKIYKLALEHIYKKSKEMHDSLI